MAEMVADCPRCGTTKTTIDVKSSNLVGKNYNWQHILEVHGVCRHCQTGTIFTALQESAEHGMDAVMRQGLERQGGNINPLIRITGFINVKNLRAKSPPAHLPANIEAAYREGAAATSIQCFNAAAAMFRLCIDLATKPMLPEEDIDGINNKIRRSLGLRLEWLFKTGRLPEALQDLSEAVKEDGNDGAHEGTLTKADAENLIDFTDTLLERLYTEPEKLRLAKIRRQERGNG